MTTNQIPMEIGDYVAVLRRRKIHVLVTFAVIMAIALGFAFGLPPVYKSEATLLIERQEIPTKVVETTVTGYVEERIQGLTQRLLTRDNLWSIVEKYNLYPEERNSGQRDEILDRMRENIVVAMVDITASSMEKARQGSITVAFTVSFEDRSPQVARQVVAELTNLYVEENKRQREEQAAQVSDFLSQEAERLSKKIAGHEADLAKFKQQNVGQLPELGDLNLRLFEQAEDEVARGEEKILVLENQRASLATQLSIMNPYKDVYTDEGKRVQSGADRLAALTSEYLRASAIYAPNHPDLVKMRREIAALEQQVGGNNRSSELVSQLALHREQLLEAAQKYSEEHPDVKKLRASIAAIEKTLRETTYPQSRDYTGEGQAVPDNPAYVAMKAQMDAVSANLQAEREKRERMAAKVREYEARLIQTPAVERDYRALTRDYDNARKRYEEIKDKLLEAQLAKDVEKGGQAERFAIVQPAHLPSVPDKPNRFGIALLGFVMAFGGGVGSASIAEYVDRSVRGRRGVIAAFRAPPLAAIPYILTPQEQMQKKKHLLRWAIVGAVAIILVLLLLIFL